MKIYYNPKLKERARELRKNSTFSEVLLWNTIKGRKLKGYQFSRQKPTHNYIVDFYCSKLKLIIEIDGDSHADKEIVDISRQKKLESFGLKIIRFSDLDVRNNMSGVIFSLESEIYMIKKTFRKPPKSPFFKGDYEVYNIVSFKLKCI